jgi:GT2 family glycosyltransferase
MINTPKLSFKNKIALIIPTRNRPELLIKLLNTIKLQRVTPDQVIIVDGSDKPIKPQIEPFFFEGLTYVHVSPPSLTTQRNQGIGLLHPSITLAGYLDDDIELKSDAIEEMLTFWENSPNDIAGAAFNIINNPKRNNLTKAFTRFFKITGKIPGKVLPSGFCTAEVPLTKDIESEWLCGGATIWRRYILEDYKYDEWYKGWAHYEDAEFSYRVSKKYRMIVLHKATVDHNPPPYNKSKNKILGKMAIINRYYFVKKNPELSIPLFYWATIGEMLLNILSSMTVRDTAGFNRALGNIEGLVDIILGKIQQIDENFRKKVP